jgi:hypothetical protein
VAVAPLSPNAVLVESRQGELLLQLARQLNGTRQARPGVSLPRIEIVPADAPPIPILKAETKDDVMEHRSHWENVETEWPFTHRSL